MTRTPTQVTRSRRHWLALALLAMLTAGWAVGCEQGDGDRCQSSDDCTEPLECNVATQTCTDKGSDLQIDATIPDGPLPDAAVDALPDSSIDSSIDAMIDAI